MSSIIRYRLGVALAIKSITMDGYEMQAKRLAEEIAKKEYLQNYNVQYGLKVLNFDTDEEIRAEDFVPRHTTVKVIRYPFEQVRKNQRNRREENPVQNAEPEVDLSFLKERKHIADLDISEEEKVMMMIGQANEEFDGVDYTGSRKRRRNVALPANYVCHMCNVTGHLIQDCPMLRNRAGAAKALTKVRRAHGIPKSFMLAGNPLEKALISGAEDVKKRNSNSDESTDDHLDRSNSNECDDDDDDSNNNNNNNNNNDDDAESVTCPICRHFQTDPVILPCCSRSICDGCCIGSVLGSSKLRCPLCRRCGISLADVVPNEALERKVRLFRTMTPVPPPDAGNLRETSGQTSTRTISTHAGSSRDASDSASGRQIRFDRDFSIPPPTVPHRSGQNQTTSNVSVQRGFPVPPPNFHRPSTRDSDMPEFLRLPRDESLVTKVTKDFGEKVSLKRSVDQTNSDALPQKRQKLFHGNQSGGCHRPAPRKPHGVNGGLRDAGARHRFGHQPVSNGQPLA